jgi:hypothetical protein
MVLGVAGAGRELSCAAAAAPANAVPGSCRGSCKRQLRLGRAGNAWQARHQTVSVGMSHPR